MNDNVELLNSVGLDDMTQKAIELVANEIEEKIRGNLQSALHEAAVKVDLTRFVGYLISNQQGAPLCHEHVRLIHPS